MKITPKQYAKALYEITVDSKQPEIKVAIAKFMETIVKNKDASKLDKIVTEFVKIWNKENNLVEAQVTVARSMDKKTRDAIGGYIGKLSGNKEVQISELVDKDVLGGLIIKYGDKVRDISLRATLIALQEAMAS